MLNENIKRLRKSKGLSQEELAMKLNVVRQTVSKWEQGRSVPDADMLISVSEVLEMPVSTLLGETVDEKEKNEQRINEFESYLRKTDWYAIRQADTGTPIPEEIKTNRQQARSEISALRAVLPDRNKN